MPIDNINSVNHAAFVPEVWLQEALGYLRNKIRLVQLVARDSDIEAGSFDVGDTVNITKRGTLVANEKTETGAIVLQQPEGSKIPVKLNQFWNVAFSASSFLKAVQIGNLEEGYISDALAVLAEKVEASLMGLYAAMAHQVGAAGADIDEATILNIRKKFNDNNAPESGRYLVVSNKDDAKLLQLDRLTRADMIGKPGAITNGAIGKAHGIEIFQSNLVRSLAGPPITYHNMAFTKWGMVLVSRPLKQIEGAVSTQIQDPDTGLIMRLTKGYNSQYNDDQIVLDMLWGVSLLRTEFAIDVLS
jgi:hypothetical protein